MRPIYIAAYALHTLSSLRPTQLIYIAAYALHTHIHTTHTHTLNIYIAAYAPHTHIHSHTHTHTHKHTHATQGWKGLTLRLIHQRDLKAHTL